MTRNTKPILFFIILSISLISGKTSAELISDKNENKEEKEKALTPQLIRIMKNKKFHKIIIDSKAPFTVGGNSYVLTIGTTAFINFTQYQKESKSRVVFYIKNREFEKLKKSDPILLSYGKKLTAIRNGSNFIAQWAALTANPKSRMWHLGNLR